jgi:hypothetical protein
VRDGLKDVVEVVLHGSKRHPRPLAWRVHGLGA